uniref:Uncharacterized protein n=1 Tax=Anopheles dirus TaxID=7168 RepID=A0A182NA54_9DIPT
MVTGRVRSSPTTSRTSSNTFRWMAGFFARLCSRKLMADVVVSWPSNMNVSTSSRISRSAGGPPNFPVCLSISPKRWYSTSRPSTASATRAATAGKSIVEATEALPETTCSVDT